MGEPVNLWGLPWTLVLLALMAVGTMGLAAFLATLQVLLRDVQQVVAVLMTLLFYATPVLYPATLVPEQFRAWLRANPLAWVVERLREVMIAGSGPIDHRPGNRAGRDRAAGRGALGVPACLAQLRGFPVSALKSAGATAST